MEPVGDVLFRWGVSPLPVLPDFKLDGQSVDLYSLPSDSGPQMDLPEKFEWLLSTALQLLQFESLRTSHLVNLRAHRFFFPAPFPLSIRGVPVGDAVREFHAETIKMRRAEFLDQCQMFLEDAPEVPEGSTLVCLKPSSEHPWDAGLIVDLSGLVSTELFVSPRPSFFVVPTAFVELGALKELLTYDGTFLADAAPLSDADTEAVVETAVTLASDRSLSSALAAARALEL